MFTISSPGRRSDNSSKRTTRSAPVDGAVRSVPRLPFPSQARRGRVAIQHREEPVAIPLAVTQRVARVPLRASGPGDDQSVDAYCLVEPRLQPLEVWPTRAHELGLEVFPVVIVASASVGARTLVDDRAVAVQEPARDNQEKVLGDLECADRQALALADPDRRKPTAEGRVTDLRPVNDAAGERADPADLVVLVEALEKVDDQLAVGARESQSAPSGDPAVCRDESDRIPEARGPLGCRHGRSAPPVEMRRHMRHVTPPTMSRRRARDPRIVLRAPTLRPALALTRRHASICTDTEVRDKPSIW